MAKTWTYHISFTATFKDGTTLSLATQLYKTGVYGIYNSDASQQGSFTPNSLQNGEKKLEKGKLKGDITSIQYGRLIKVTTDESGFYKEVNQ